MNPHFAIDFAQPRTRPHRATWLLLAVGLAALLASAFALHGAWAARDENAQQVDRLQTAVARRSTQARPVAPVAKPAEQRLHADLARVAADLHRPWFELFDVLEAHSKPQLQLQQLTVDGGFARAQLQVEAKGLGEVLAYVRELERAGGPVRGAQLVSHEWLGAAGEGATAPAPAANPAGTPVAPRRLQARIALALKTLPLDVAAAPAGVGTRQLACSGAACVSGKLP